MPHFGLMDEKKLGPVAGPLQRSRLHLRSARRLLREGRIATGIVTLYDALSGGMESFAADPVRRAVLSVRTGEDLRQDADLYRVLVRSGVVEEAIDFGDFEGLMEKALGQELPALDHRELLQGIERLLTQLGVLPFDEASLPPEKPEKFMRSRTASESNEA